MTTTTEYPSATAKAKFVRVSASKARRVIDLVRGKSVAEALDILRWAPQAASEPVAKVIASAAANAQNNEGLDPDTLVVAAVMADEGPTAKRIRPRAQGRAFRINKRTSHITVVLATPAPWRPDLNDPFDLVEEVARTVHISRQLGEPLPIAQSAIDSLYARYQNVYGQH